MPSAYLLCGPSLAGKSTLCREIVQRLGHLGAVICSADAINEQRGLPFGAEGLPESVWAETLRIQLLELQAAGMAGTSVVVDDTLCFRWLRDRLRETAVTAGLTPQLLLLRPAREEVFARWELAARSKSRPVLSVSRLAEHFASFEWPAIEEGAIDVTTSMRQEAWLQAELAARQNVT